LQSIAITKVRHFAAQARALDISEFQDNLPKRRTLLLCLLYEAQVNTRDYLDVFIKRILKIQNNAKQRLQELRDKHLTETSELLTTFGQVLKASTKPKKLRMLFFGEQVQSILDEHGGTELLLQSWMRLQLTTPTIIYR